MNVRFWGVRGSIPTPPTSAQVHEKMLHLLRLADDVDLSTPGKRSDFLDELSPLHRGVIGGNTSCVELRTNNKILVFDMGSGLKQLGNHIMKTGGVQDKVDIHIFISHTHWDHIMGFPFFTPAYLPQATLHFYSPHDSLEERLSVQQDYRFFPVSLDDMASAKRFHTFKPNSEMELDGIIIKNIQLHHPGDSYGYRVESEGKSFVYSTDSEYKDLSQKATTIYTNFFQGADAITFDSQYTLVEAVHHKEDWGHSSAIIGIDFCAEAEVKRLILYHHEPENDDYMIQSLLEEAEQYRAINYPDSQLELMIGYEGLSLEL